MQSILQRISVFALLLIVVIALAACGDATSTAQAGQPTSTANPAAQATHPASTATASGIAPTSGPALLGADIGTFVAQYGQPNDHTDVKIGQYHFQRYGDSNVDAFIVATDLTDGNAYLHRVDDITAASPSAGWTSSEASAKCAVFFPRDAVYKRQVATQNGIDKIYFSQSLASLFPASAFTDAQQNAVKAGYFDVLYLARTDGMIDDCDIIIGEQQTQ